MATPADTNGEAAASAHHTSATLSKRFLEGPLSKWTNVVNGWQYRWFVLDQSAGLLSYYTSKDKMKRGSRRGCFQLRRAIIGIDDEDDSTFTIRVENRIYHFQAQNSEERQQWVSALDACIRRLHQPSRPLDISLSTGSKMVSLDQQVEEAESYYQLLQEQVQGLSTTMNSSEEAEQLRNTAKDMLEALRQCIYIIKESDLVETPVMSDPNSLEPTPPPPEVVVNHTPRDQAEAAVPSISEEGPAVVRGSPAARRRGTETTAGDLSNSTSTSDIEKDSEEEFFDAEMEGEWSVGGVTVSSPSMSVPVAEEDPSDVEEDEDFLEDDDASDGVQANKSVIMHMLSQVRVGMDLTRIVLPTFILEKRSLLEMYAEFLAHPDLFAAIPDNSDPRDRIVAIVRYYLSSFHAARKGTIAKKPYNPVLGETFRCYWDLPNSTRNPPNSTAKEILESGPVPFASYNSVTFVAEQVSHHPPVSGFYAECPSKNMFVHGSIWTKSKFLGLSLGVHMIGAVHLHLLDYDEVYTSSLPNAYGRSILTVPWLEMGGKVNLTCEKTGYAANIDFHCKPFYGGKKHRVTAEIFHVSDKKPFVKVEGEWNGVMYRKFPNGDTEVFMDTLNTPTYRKKLQRLSSQQSTESRKKWKDVTAALKRKDVEAATDAKHAIEEKQRADARERKEKGEEWQQKLFHLEGEEWVFNDSLDKRKQQVPPITTPTTTPAAGTGGTT